MAKDQADFRVQIYGDPTRDVKDRMGDMQRRPSGGGGLPWFRNNSPTFPGGPSAAPSPLPSSPFPASPYPAAAPPAPPGGIPPEVAGIFAGLTAKDWIKLAAAVGGITGGAMSNKPNMAPNTLTSDPQLQELIQMMSGRLKKSEPLFDSVQSMANGLLPTQYQKGGGGMG